MRTGSLRGIEPDKVGDQTWSTVCARQRQRNFAQICNIVYGRHSGRISVSTTKQWRGTAFHRRFKDSNGTQDLSTIKQRFRSATYVKQKNTSVAVLYNRTQTGVLPSKTKIWIEVYGVLQGTGPDSGVERLIVALIVVAWRRADMIFTNASENNLPGVRK